MDEVDSGKVRKRLRKLLAVIVVSFVLLWTAGLVDHLRREALRQHFEQQLLPAVHGIEMARLGATRHELLLIRAIGESDRYVLEEAEQSRLQVADAFSDLLAATEDDPAVKLLAERLQAHQQQGEWLAAAIVTDPGQMQTLSSQAQQRLATGAELFAELERTQARFGDEVGAGLQQSGRESSRNLIVGSALLLLLLVAALAVLRTVGRAIDAYGRKLRSQAQHFATLYNETPALLVTTDADGRCVTVSDFFLQESDTTRVELLGRRLTEIVRPLDERHLVLGKSGRWDEYEAELTRPDGSCSTLLVRTRLKPDEERRVLTVMVDITERKRVERELARLNQELERRVEARTAELSAANQQLAAALEQLRKTSESLIQSEKLAALGGLVAGVAHELNTPIGTALTAATHMHQVLVQIEPKLAGNLRRSDLQSAFDSLGEGVGIVLRTLRRGSELVQSFKQIAVDQSSERRRRFELSELVGDVLRSLSPTLARTPYAVTADVPAGLQMDSLPGLIEQVLTNLCQNAVMHGFDGREHGAIAISACRVGDDALQLEVSDDGRGMNDEQLRRCFEPFYTTRLGRGGSGLGLHIVYNQVSGPLGGEITVARHQPSGTAIRLRLPLSAPG